MTQDREFITFNGKVYHRYPKSKNWADRNYFRRGAKYLHRELWKSLYGDIPDGYDVHHIDGDTSHNVIENLDCLPSFEHQCNHEYTKSDEYKARRRENLDRHRDKSRAWHASEQGKEQHKKLGKWAWKVRKARKVKCDYCGRVFETKDTRSQTRFCSNNCRTQARRASAVDNEDRICVWCATVFRVNKYSRTRCCSGSCAAHYRNSKRK